MPKKGQAPSAEDRIQYEIGERLREVGRIARLAEPTDAQKKRAIKLGEELRMLRKGIIPHHKREEADHTNDSSTDVA